MTNFQTVFFIGAGFSAPFGYPTMAGFNNFALTRSNLVEDQKKLIREATHQSTMLGSYVMSNPYNLEHVLSCMVMRARIGSDEGKLEQWLDILKEVYGSVSQEIFLSRCRTAKQSLRLVQLGHLVENMSFITTNYDLCIESSIMQRIGSTMSNCKFQYHDQIEASGSKAFYGAGGIKVLKLHGSVNWTEDDDSLKANLDYEILPSDGKFLKSPSNGLRPVIVPPSFLKHMIHPNIIAAWKTAAETLRNAAKLTFIGYSFPWSDTEMRFFLGDALSENAALETINIVDINAQAIVERLRAPNSGYGPIFKEKLVAHPYKWEEMSAIP